MQPSSKQLNLRHEEREKKRNAAKKKKKKSSKKTGVKKSFYKGMWRKRN